MRGLAGTLQITHATVSDVLSGKSNAGAKLLNAVAEATNLTPKQLKLQAAEWAKANPPRDAVVVREARYPRLELAIQFAADSKPASAEAIEYVRSIALKSNDDRSAEEWLQELRFAERLIREKAGPQLPARPMPPPEGRPPLAERLAKAKKGGT